jgi:hypothetical protein
MLGLERMLMEVRGMRLGKMRIMVRMVGLRFDESDLFW